MYMQIVSQRISSWNLVEHEGTNQSEMSEKTEKINPRNLNQWSWN